LFREKSQGSRKLRGGIKRSIIKVGGSPLAFSVGAKGNAGNVKGDLKSVAKFAENPPNVSENVWRDFRRKWDLISFED